jgi:hypothetical protein
MNRLHSHRRAPFGVKTRDACVTKSGPRLLWEEKIAASTLAFQRLRR